MSTQLPNTEQHTISTAELQRLRDRLAYIDAQALRSRCHQCNAAVERTQQHWRWNNERGNWEHYHYDRAYPTGGRWFSARTVSAWAPALYTPTRLLAYRSSDIGRFTNDWLILPSSVVAS